MSERRAFVPFYYLVKSVRRYPYAPPYAVFLGVHAALYCIRSARGRWVPYYCRFPLTR